MALQTRIEWTNRRLPDGRVIEGATFNPWIGCEKVSPACDHCYAERDATRRKVVAWGGAAAGGQRRLTSPGNWVNMEAMARRAAKEGVRPLVFTASWADVFEEWKGELIDHRGQVILAGPGQWSNDPTADAYAEYVKRGDPPVTMDQARSRLFRLMARTAHALDWLVLTKRAGALCREWPRLVAVYATELQALARADARYGPAWTFFLANSCPANAWPGVTVEDQKWADHRLGLLNQVNAARRFVSAEPLVGPVAALPYLARGQTPCAPGVHWVITGGESGPAARAGHPDWYRRLRDDCAKARIPFFFKQWGEVIPLDHAVPPELADGVNVVAPAGTPERNVWREEAPADDAREMQLREECRAGRVGLPMLGYRVGKKAAGRVLDGRTHDEIPDSCL